MAHVDRLHLGMLCKEGRELTDVSQHPLGESSTFCMKCGLVSTVVVGETGVGWGGGDVKEEPWGRAGAWACKSPWESVGLGWVGQGGSGTSCCSRSLLGLALPRPLELGEQHGPTGAEDRAPALLPASCPTGGARAGMGRGVAAVTDLPLLSPRLVSASDRESRLEEVRSAFLASYSRTIGLKAVPPSPSGAIGGLLEQFVRGVGLRGSSTL